MLRIIKFVLPLLFLLQGCGGFEYSPNQVFSGDSRRDINQNNIERLVAEPADELIRFVLTGDSQRAYKDAKDLVKAINQLDDIDFVVLNGDISDFGLYQEMESVDRLFSKLRRPYIGVIGNHDLVAKSPNTLAALFAHTHNHRVFYPGFQESIPYIITDPIENRKFTLIEILDGELKFQNIDF